MHLLPRVGIDIVSAIATGKPERNLGTDPYQIQERFMRKSRTEDMDEVGKVGADTSYLQSQMHSDLTQRRALQTRTLKMENYEK